MSKQPDQKPDALPLYDAVDQIIIAANRLIKGIGLYDPNSNEGRQAAMNAAIGLWGATRPCQHCSGQQFQAPEDVSVDVIVEVHKDVDSWKLREAADVLDERKTNGEL